MVKYFTIFNVYLYLFKTFLQPKNQFKLNIYNLYTYL